MFEKLKEHLGQIAVAFIGLLGSIVVAIIANTPKQPPALKAIPIVLSPKPIDGLFDRGFVLDALEKDGRRIVTSKTRLSFSVDSRLLYNHSMEEVPDQKVIALDAGSHAFEFALDVHSVGENGEPGFRSVRCAGTFEVTGGRTLYPHLDFETVESKTSNGYTLAAGAPKCSVGSQ